MSKTITLYENFRALFYAPFYLAFEIGAFEAEGVAVALGESNTPGEGAKASLERDDAISWGGPMRVLHFHDQDPTSDLVCFCEVVGGDPFHIIGREPKPNFTLSDLTTCRFGNFIEAVTPWLCLQEDLRREGIDPDSLERTSDNSVPENMADFKAGTLDAVQLLEPYAEMLLETGDAHLWFEASSRGPCAYTSYYTKRQLLDDRADELQAMTTAMAKTLDWTHSHSAEDLAKAIGGYFPDFSQDLMARSLARYKKGNIWNETPTLNVQGFERLRAGLLSGGLISREIPYDEIVDMRFVATK
jgi:NitT/TauT family transport system substrate-binding protein